MEDPAGAELHGRISNDANRIAVAIQQSGVDQGGQAIHHGQIGVGRGSLHQRLELAQAPQLIQSPSLTTIAKGHGLADPAQQTMHRWMHPGNRAVAVVDSLIAAHPPAQQIAQQQLLRQAH